MSRIRTLIVVVLLLSYGAVGARQPAVRGAAPLPGSARAVADAAGLPSADTSLLLFHLVRLVYDTPDIDSPRVRKLRADLQQLRAEHEGAGDRVPLPLDPSIWRDTILERQPPDDLLVAEILSDPRASLLYHGLSALDDETLGWLGPDRETLRQLRSHAGAFAAFGRSVRVRSGRVAVPGGDRADALWTSVIGVSPSKPAAFVQRLFKDEGRAAFFYDTIAHLDPPRQRFALGLHLPESAREDRFGSLFDLFLSSAADWRPEQRPFSRPMLDPGVVLATVEVTGEGVLEGPVGRRLWDRVFQGDAMIDVAFSAASPFEVARENGERPADAARLVGRVSRVPYTIGRRRLDTILFAQRVFRDARADVAEVATALRGFIAYPALMLTLERVGITDPAVFAAGARRAAIVDAIGPAPARRATLVELQSALGIIERIGRTGVLDAARSKALILSLLDVEVSAEGGYEELLARWVRSNLATILPSSPAAVSDPIENAILSAMAGVSPERGTLPVIEWEGSRYRVDPAAAELARMRLVRGAQGGLSVDAAVAAVNDSTERKGGRDRRIAAEQALGDTLASVLYTAYLGEPAGSGVTSGNVALRHDLGLDQPSVRSGAPWRLPIEDFRGRAGWRLRGSLLGLDAALGQLSLRRLDPTSMPFEPKLGMHDRIAVGVMASLLNPFAMTDVARDEIAATLARGRARAAALTADAADLDRAAGEAGLSEWRRQALAWAANQAPNGASSQFSLLELFWLGAPRPSAVRALDAWGAAVLPLTGCLCLEMPAPRAWEELAGRRSSGIMATRAADVALRVADALAARRLPAALAPAVLAFALQDVTDSARLAYPDDWQEFGRAARDLPAARLDDYIAALTAKGPLVPVEADK